MSLNSFEGVPKEMRLLDAMSKFCGESETRWNFLVVLRN